jgi:phage terminase large subunit-like protein
MNTQTIEFENKSTIKLTGADSSRTDMDKLLGGKYFIVAIDECQSWTQDLDRLVNIVFAPAVTDYIKKGGGQIILAGTPGPHMGDAWYWYNLTKPIQDDKKIKGWNVHHWDPLDNPHMKEEILDTWALLEKAHGPRYRERPDFRSEWLCQWVLQEGLKVYNYDKAINKIVEKEDFTATSLDSNTLSLLFAAEQDTKRTLLERDKKWFYILGCDLGFIDDCAWVVGAFNKTDNMFYFVESFSHNKINLKVFADITKGLMLKYSFRSMVVDEGGLGKMMADTCRTHYQIPFKPAEKTGKESFIYTMNSDFSTGQIKVIHQSNVKLIKEWDELIIDEKAAKEGIFKEAEKYKNHLSDAALYCYREGKHYLSKPEPVKINDIAQRIIDQQKKSRFPNRDNSYRDSWQEHIENQRIIDTFRGSK